MENTPTTLEQSASGVTSVTLPRKMSFHRITEDEIESLMDTSYEFQFFTGLASLSLGALVSSFFSEISTTTEAVIQVSSGILSAIFIVISIYFYRKMKTEKRASFKKFEVPAGSTHDPYVPTTEELSDIINDLLAQIADLQKHLGD